MDWSKWKQPLKTYLGKYGYVAIILLAGIFMMCIPQEKDPPVPAEQAESSQQAELRDSLEHILSLIEGVGKVELILTEETGEEYLYQTDIDRTLAEQSSDEQKRTVMTTNGQREETGLIRQINPPKLRGAVVVCQGANHAGVRLSVVEAVMKATGLPSSSICVVKMK